jgi:tryptophan synthase alpha chain
MPFTDPMADGPAIQAANLRSLAKGTTTADLFAIAAAFRARHPDTPLVLMGYANPMTIRGPEWFAGECAKAGVDGIICVDIPSEEDAELGPALRASGASILSASPRRRPTPRACPPCSNGASGFLYYVSVAGITGQQQAAQDSIEAAVARLKAATDLPVAVGFGVRTPEQAAQIGRVADGVVVGSAIIDIIAAAGRRCRAACRGLSSVRSPMLSHARKGDRRMSWLDRVRNAISLHPAKRDTARQSLAQMPGCGQMVFVKEWEDNLSVCPRCDHHERIGAKERFAQLFDGGIHELMRRPPRSPKTR